MNYNSLEPNRSKKKQAKKLKKWLKRYKIVFKELGIKPFQGVK